jgi:hypothetical protein
MAMDSGARLVLLCDDETMRGRLSLAAACAMRLRKYRGQVSAIERLSGTEHSLVDRARAAEQQGRVLIKLTLDGLNDLRDSGTLQNLGGLFDDKAPKLRDQFEGMKKNITAFKNAFPDVASFFDALADESLTMLNQTDLNIEAQEKDLMVSVKGLDGKPFSRRISGSGQVGGLGRVSTRDFFSARAPSVTHVHRRLRSDELPDPYGEFVALLAHVRDELAHQTRLAEYFGRPHVRGHGAILAAIIFGPILLVGLGITIACGVDKQISSGVCNVGNALLLGGLAGGAATCAMMPGSQVPSQLQSPSCQVIVSGPGPCTNGPCDN